MTIQSVGATFQIPGGAVGAFLTPDALMAYCQSRLEGLDTQMDTAMAKQQQANDDSNVLSNLASQLTVRGDKLDLNDAGGFATAKSYADAMMNAAGQIKDPAAKQALIDKANAIYTKLNIACVDVSGETSVDVTKLTPDQLKDYMPGGSKHHNDPPDGTNNNPNDRYISVDEMKALSSDAVANIQKDLNSGAELSMINLQSLMSQRQQAIQLATNLVQSLGDQCNKIAENVGK